MADTDFVNYTPNMGLDPTKDTLKQYFTANPSDSNEYMGRYLSQAEPSPTQQGEVIADKEPYNLSDVFSKVTYFNTVKPSQNMTQYKDSIPTKTPQEFLQRYGKLAADSAAQTGISKELILAQLALESGWGEHVNQNNIGNIKPGVGWKGGTQTLMTTEYDPKKGYSKLNQEFRAYRTPEEGFQDYAKFLSTNKRYASVIGVKDSLKAADLMGKTGYATDPEYSQKLRAIIAKIREINIV